MNRISQKLSVAIGAASICTPLLVANPAQAITFSFDFDVDIFDGPLMGQTFTGSASYDDSTLTGIGSESVLATSVEFMFVDVNQNDANYDESDDIGFPLFPKVLFVDGTLLSLDFAVEPLKEGLPDDLVPSFFNIFFEDGFQYDLGVDAQDNDRGFGFGSVAYSTPTPVPEPTSVLGLLAVGAFGSTLKRKQKQLA